MLDKINLTKDDLIIILGDSCDRGDGSAKLFLKYKELLANGYSLKHILGNHEVMMDRAYFNQDAQMKSVWLYNGGIDTIESFDALSSVQKESLLSWLKEWVKAMPHTYLN